MVIGKAVSPLVMDQNGAGGGRRREGGSGGPVMIGTSSDCHVRDLGWPQGKAPRPHERDRLTFRVLKGVLWAGPASLLATAEGIRPDPRLSLGRGSQRGPHGRSEIGIT